MWLLLAAAAALPFVGTMRYDLVWDDHYVLAHIVELQRAGGLGAVLSAPFFPHPGVPNAYYRPLIYLSLWLDNWLGQGASAWFHSTNVVLHVGCTLLTGLLFNRLAGDVAVAFAGGLLFALHPVHVESVAFVSGRTDLFATLFVLVAALMWGSARDPVRSPARRAGLLAGSALAFFAGLLSKENSVLLPIVLLVWDQWAETRRVSQDRMSWAHRNATWLLLYGLSLSVFFLLRHVALRAGPVDYAAVAAAPLLVEQPRVAALGLLQMLRMLVLPWPHNALYGQPQLILAPLSSISFAVVFAIILMAGKRRFSRIGAIGGLWLAVFLAPALLVPAGGAVVVAERYLYLPSVGFCLALGALLAAMFRLLERWQVVLAIAVGVLGLALADVARVTVWQDDLTLARDMVRTSPGSALAHDRLGQALLGEKHYREAFDAFREAVSLEPGNPAYHNDLGIALRRLGKPDLAAEAFREALRLDPGAIGTRLNLSYACITLRDRACVEEQRSALRGLDPSALEELDRVLRKTWR